MTTLLSPHSFSFVVLFFLLTITVAQKQRCTNPASPCDPSVDYFPFKPKLNHIKTAKLDYKNTFVDITVTDNFGGSYPLRIVKCGCTAPNSTNPNLQVINTTPERVFVDDSPSLAFLTHSLSQGERIVAIGSPERVYSESITSRIQVPTELPQIANGSVEIDLGLVSTFGVTSWTGANISAPYFVNGETQEPTPLARGEWIKIFAILFDDVYNANLKFIEIESRYNNMKKRANAAQRRPSVFMNWPFGNTWSQPSENQYITEILRDANVDYRYMFNGNSSSVSKTFEEITTEFKWARYWLQAGRFPPNTNTSMEDFFLDEAQNETNNAIALNKVFKSLAAVRCANIWRQEKRIAVKGANDFFEWGAVRPDLILEDIVRAVHPNADVSNETTFMFKTEDGPDDIKGGPCPYNNLMGPAAEGMVYVDTEMSVTGMNRFDIEDKLVEDIMPEVSKDERIPLKNIDIFFEKPQENDTSTLLLRTMVSQEDSDDVVKDSDAITKSVQAALGSDATVQFLSVRKSNQDITLTETNSLSAGAIAGIVVGALLAVAIVGVILFYFGTKRGANVAEEDLKDRFWNEHGVRLADDFGE